MQAFENCPGFTGIKAPGEEIKTTKPPSNKPAVKEPVFIDPVAEEIPPAVKVPVSGETAALVGVAFIAGGIVLIFSLMIWAMAYMWSRILKREIR